MIAPTANPRWTSGSTPYEQAPNLLLVDDDRVMRIMLRETLINCGYNVHIVANADEALQVLNEDALHIDAAILDREMPGMNGLQLVAKMKEHPRHSTIPIIMLTGSAEQHKIQEGIDAGVYCYLVKSADDKLLRSVIESALREGRQKSAPNSELDRLVNDTSRLAQYAVASPSDYGIDEAAFIIASDILGDKLSAILTCYLEDAEGYIERLAESVATRDMEAAITPAHTLKSSSRQLGVTTLAELAAQAEMVARQESSETACNAIAQMLPAMREALVRIRPFFHIAGAA